MKILVTADPMLAVPPVLYGGIERIVAKLIAELVLRRHSVALLAHKASRPAERILLYPWPDTTRSRTIDVLAHANCLGQAVRRFRPDVIHSFSRLLYLAPILARSVPKVMSFQREPTRRTVKWAARIAGASLQFTGCSDYISARGRAAGGNWSTVYNFVDPRGFTFQPTVAVDAPLVFLSRIERIKGAHTAIEACRRAGRKLIIAGNHSEDESANGVYWRKEILPHLGRDGIEYVGPVNDEQKYTLLGQAAAMIVPIEWEEPFGIVFAEALACGTPVISCPRGALPEIVEDQKHGFLCLDLEQMGRSIKDISRIERAKCRERAVQMFSVDTAVSRYEQLYARLAVQEQVY